MAVNFLLKRSNTASKRPTAAQLDIGELSLNYDANTAGVFFEDGAGNVRKVGPAEVSASAPNATPAGSTGNSLGEFWYDTAATNLKIWTGSAFVNATTNITGSAATLTTTRTIWGQNFNGSANVSGAISGATNILAGSGTSGAVTTPPYLSLGANFTNTTLRANCKVRLYENGADIYGFSIGPAGDVQYHSTTTHQFYNSDVATFTINATGATSTGIIQGTRFTSTVATGTAPLTVASTTLVTNLNADLLDGISSGSFLRSDANNDTATGTIYTSSWIEAGRTSGSIALTANDGYGNANVAFNHKAGIPDATGSSGRIRCDVDSATAFMTFQLGNNSTSGVTTSLTSILDLTTSGASVTGTLTSSSTVQGTRLISTIATGTAPLTVASTTLVTNLNADLLDGLNSASTNTVSTIVARDASGNFSAGTITATLTGNASSATNLAGGSIGTIPYQSGAGATAMLAVGTAGQALVSAGAAAPTWATLTLENLPDAAFKRSVRVATTADLGASTFAAGVLTGYDDVISLNVTTTLSSTTATTTSTAGIKVGAVISGNANIPAATTVASITNATTFVMSAAATAAGTAVATTFTQTIAALVVDGITLALNDRVLVKNQSTLGGLADASGAAKNGIYRLSTLGSATVPWVLTRTADADAAAELGGAVVNADSGTVNGGFLFDTDFKTTDTLNTTNMVWSRIVDTGLGNTTAGTIAMNGVQAAGTSDLYARADHVHPSDTSRAPLASPTFTGTPLSTTAAVDTNTTQIATTAFVVGQASATNPLALGTVAVGTSLRYARQDHVHPTTGLGLTSGTLAQFAATTSAQLAGVISDETGSGALVFATSPSLTTPNIGAATGTTLSTSGIITNGGFDFILGTTDQVSRGNSGSSRVLVKDAGTVLTINYAGDFTGGTRVQGPSFSVSPGARTSGSAAYFAVLTPADTTLTASTESIGANFSAATRQFATGALTLQRERVFAAPTYGFVAASTLTTAINVDIAAPIQGTNATITSAWALRAAASQFTGTVQVTGLTASQAVFTDANDNLVSNAITGSGSVVMSASPTLSGTPLSTTAAVDTNTTQIATTAFVVGQASATNPLALGTVAVGTSLRYARQDHVHPTTGLGLTSGTLAQFAATTSAQLAGVISDETGSGVLVFATSPSLTTPALSGETFSTTNNVTAGTNAQGQGALTSDYNVVTTAASNPSGVTLPTATTGRRVIIVNKGANPIRIFPATGASIDALAANTAIQLAVNGVMMFNAASTTLWYSSANLQAAAVPTDGDKGDITVSGTGSTWTIDNTVVTYAKIQNVSTNNRILGRTTAGAGSIEELTTIPATVLGNSSLFVGTTSIALNRASAAQSLTGITSIDGSAATLTTTRTLWGQNFNGGANVTGSLTSVGDITGAGAVNLSSAAATALNLTAGTTGAVTLDSGSTGAVNIGNNANAKTITLGNVTGATTINVNSGTGGILVTSPHLTMANQGALRLREATGGGTNYIGLQAPAAVTADLTFTVPGTDANTTTGYTLKSNGSAALSFGTANIVTSDTAPAGPLDGDLWYNSANGRLFIYYADGTTNQWVDASPDSSGVTNIRILDSIAASFNGTTATFNLTVSAAAVSPVNAQQLLIVVGGVVQMAGTHYTVSGSTITFTAGNIPTSGLTFYGVIYGDAATLNTIADGAVTTAKIQNSSVTAAKLSIDATVLPTVDNSFNLGSASFRFANIFTGDLHLKNDRGDWTIIEEDDCLTMRNNKTGKIYEIMMKERTA